MITWSLGFTTTQALISAPSPAAARAEGTWKPTVSPPPIAAEVLRNLRREGMNLAFMVISSGLRFRGLHHLCRRMDCGADARVGAAAADVGHGVVDVAVARVRVLCEQRRGDKHLPTLTVAALRHLVLEPGLLHRVHAAARREPLDGGDLFARRGRDRKRTGTDRVAVDMDGAGAALGDAATEFGSLDVEHVPQYPQQGHLGLDVDLLDLAVHCELDHRTPP